MSAFASMIYKIFSKSPLIAWEMLKSKFNSPFDCIVRHSDSKQIYKTFGNFKFLNKIALN